MCACAREALTAPICHDSLALRIGIEQSASHVSKWAAYYPLVMLVTSPVLGGYLCNGKFILALEALGIPSDQCRHLTLTDGPDRCASDMARDLLATRRLMAYRASNAHYLAGRCHDVAWY